MKLKPDEYIGAFCILEEVKPPKARGVLMPFAMQKGTLLL